MILPEHLKPWGRFMKGLSTETLTSLRRDETITSCAERLLLQSLYEAGCLRRPETAEANREREHINESRGMER